MQVEAIYKDGKFIPLDPLPMIEDGKRLIIQIVQSTPSTKQQVDLPKSITHVRQEILGDVLDKYIGNEKQLAHKDIWHEHIEEKYFAK
ncbi:MAG: DUF104 domain-containing protein [Desulfomicrobium sp.]|nr:DUF104 domain-containing protein [Desulfomicrobium sp.]